MYYIYIYTVHTFFRICHFCNVVLSECPTWTSWCCSQICAVVGGIFTVAGLVDSAPRRGVECLEVSELRQILKDFERISKVLHKSIVHLAKKARPLFFGFKARGGEMSPNARICGSLMLWVECITSEHFHEQPGSTSRFKILLLQRGHVRNNSQN